MTTTTLTALISDAIRAGIDNNRIHLGPLDERHLIAGAIEHIETAGYTLTLCEGDGWIHTEQGLAPCPNRATA